MNVKKFSQIKALKEQKGITLTMLVVTVIVMLIIAGASATMIFDKEGLLKKSQESKEKQEQYANTEETKTNSLINEVDEVIKSHNEPPQKEYTFPYTRAVQEWIVPMSGVWKLEVWGAQGGPTESVNYYGIGGKGGYSVGEIELEKNNKLYIYVGQAGFQSASEYSFNGGGYGNPDTSNGNGYTGGGATDIRIEGESLYRRIIVAGGGGAGAGSTNSGWTAYTANGGYGGGATAGAGLASSGRNGYGSGGTQTGIGTFTKYDANDETTRISPEFGKGGTCSTATNDGIQGGGGRKWLVWRRRRRTRRRRPEVVALAGFTQKLPITLGKMETQQMQINMN